jgi:hypothetical protein
LWVDSLLHFVLNTRPIAKRYKRGLRSSRVVNLDRVVSSWISSILIQLLLPDVLLLDTLSRSSRHRFKLPLEFFPFVNNNLSLDLRDIKEVEELKYRNLPVFDPSQEWEGEDANEGDDPNGDEADQFDEELRLIRGLYRARLDPLLLEQSHRIEDCHPILIDVVEASVEGSDIHVYMQAADHWNR